ncbi:MAG TPA: malectin domain-containing carbohydrate-binding protein [Lacipirellulaceae bacterium]|nr:malectin domain-containing carbohydrate-binding protein [Lacipirellulaceae bacterium]
MAMHRTRKSYFTSGRRLSMESLEQRDLLAVLFRVNAGGPALAGAPGWAADTTASPSTLSNAASGGNSTTRSSTAAVNMTHASLPAGTPSALFQTERFDKPGGAEMLWDFPVSPGQYEVRLYFAETWSGAFANGARVFDVKIEGVTVLDNYDVFSEVGANKGVMKSFTIASDSNIDLDFLRVTENPAIKGIEILSAATPAPLQASASSLDFGDVPLGQTASRQLTLTNGAEAGGANVTVDPGASALTPAGTQFSFNFAQSSPIVLAPGQSTVVTVSYSPTAAGASAAGLAIAHNGANPPLNVQLAGQGVQAAATVAYRINAGGPAVAGTPTWQADPAASPSSFSNASTGGNSATTTTSATIDMTHPSLPAGTPMAIFQSERFDKPTGANLEWNFPVSAGQYEVRLYFAETFSGAFAAGARVFDVALEGAVVLDNYDVFADVGALKGVMKSFVVSTDSNLDIDFLRGAQNPAVKAIEILALPPSSGGGLNSSATAINFGSVVVGQSSSQQVTLANNSAPGGASITINPASASVTPAGSPYAVSFGQTGPIVLAPGQSQAVTVTYSPTTAVSHPGTLTIPHSGSGSPLAISLAGSGTAVSNQISFAKSLLGGATGLERPTSLQFGPDGRLYVAQQNGLIRVYSITRTAANDYDVTAQETISLIQSIPNHHDNGALNTSINTRLVTGLLVTGTAANPVLYVNSSDPRIGGGNSGADLNLDTNSSTVSRLTKSGASWTKLDLVRGLPRSEENHHANGLQLDAATNTLYIAVGGNTNMGATSNNFSRLPEFALSAAILKIDLTAIGNTTYNLPTLDDETRATNNDANDPFGGNNGLNQAIIVPGGPVQIYSPGYRNAYDLVITASGRMYTVDNGPNAGWGDIPIGEGPNGTATNALNEPGVTHGDGLHYVTGPGYYGGHTNPTRANRNNTFNVTNPQSPVPVANPIEGDYRVPGPESGALVVFPESTNGIAEYRAGFFGGAMQGDLLMASFDNTIKRVKLSADGAQVVFSENLFSNVGSIPLDVTTPAAGPFAGTIWVCDVASGQITVFEPSAGTGGNPNDFDGDGYTNADESANGTDPNSPADIPPDHDADFISNLSDPNDDNDSFTDATDKFAVDGSNGASTPVGTFYGWENEGADSGGLLGTGFTGLMTNGSSDYESLYNASEVTAGGAAGVFTIDAAGAGSAKGTANTQTQAFQFGVNVGGQTGPYMARTSILGPFNGLTPQAGQQMGMFIGAGDQDNYIQLVISGDNGGSIQLGKEVGGVFTTIASQNLSLVGVSNVEFRLTIDPVSDTLQATFAVNGGSFATLGGGVSVPAAWISSVMAVGLIATDPVSSGLPVTWDYIGVQSAVPVSGDPEGYVFIEGLGGTLLTASVFGTGSFKIQNRSTGNVRIQSVTIDTRTAILPDMVFDPLGDGGNDIFKAFTPDAGASLTGLTGHSHASEHGGGFDILTVNFSEFDPGEEFVFSIDMEPTTIKGSEAPGPSQAGKVSGLELTGSTVTIVYSDGTTTVTQTMRTAANNRASHTIADTVKPPTPGLTLQGSLNPPAETTTANHTVRITGPAGAVARLLHLEASLHLAGVPGGGFDIDPFEANKATKLTDKTVTIGASGFVDVPIVLTKGETQGGYNYITAVIQDSQGRTSDNAPDIVLKYNPGGSAAAAVVASGDFDGNGVTDGNDFVIWQRGGTAEELADWRASIAANQAAGGAGESATNAPLAVQAAAPADEAAARDQALAGADTGSFVASLTQASPTGLWLSSSAPRGRRIAPRGALLPGAALAASGTPTALPLLVPAHAAGEERQRATGVDRELAESPAGATHELDAAFDEVGWT